MAYTIGNGIVWILGTVVIVATALPLLRHGQWWIRVFDFPRAQIFILGLAVLALFLLAFDPVLPDVLFLSLLIAALSIQAWSIFPYTALAPKQVLDSRRSRSENSFRLMVANVLVSNRNAGGLRQQIEEAKPDLFLAVETDRWWQEQLQYLEKTFPYTVQYPLDNTYGMLLYSRFPLLEKNVRFLIKEDIPSIQVKFRLPSEADILLWCVHPEPPSPGEAETSNPRDAELLRVGKEVRKMDHPVVVAGDLNDVAWSWTTRLFQRTSGLLDPRIGRGRYSTFHARYPVLRWPLDHIFHSRHFKLLDLTVLDDFGSDHFPILAALSYEPEQKKQQDAPAPDHEDRAQAKEKIAEGKAH